MFQVMEAGLSFDQLDVGTKIELKNNDDGHEGEVIARWGPLEDSNSNVRMDFVLNNQESEHYTVQANLQLPGLDIMTAIGEMTLSPPRSSLDLKCERLLTI